MKGTYLRQRGTGRLYAWTPQLEARSDMDPCDADGAILDPARAEAAKMDEPLDDDALAHPDTRLVPPDDSDGAIDMSEPDPEEPADPEGTDAMEPRVEPREIRDHEIIVGGEVLDLDKATAADKLAMDHYAERQFGVKLDRRKSASVMAARLKKLIAERGHPDAD